MGFVSFLTLQESPSSGGFFLVDASAYYVDVLVACEFSGIVRDAFNRVGHNAVSCDILPTESDGEHIQDDILKHPDKGWDKQIIGKLQNG